jgi:hypothetical protein
MRKFIAALTIVGATSLAASLPASAQFGLPTGGALPIPGLGGGGGGGGFSAAANSLAINLKTALYNQGMALSLVADAMGDKKKADLFRSQSAAIQSVKGANKDSTEKFLKTVENNPIDLKGLANVQDEAGKKKIATAQGHMDVVIVYDALAIASAVALVKTQPGPSDIASAPTVLEAAQLAITALPTQTSNAKKFNEAVEGYMKTNNVAKLSASQKTALAKKTDPGAKNDAMSKAMSN